MILRIPPPAKNLHHCSLSLTKQTSPKSSPTCVSNPTIIRFATAQKDRNQDEGLVVVICSGRSFWAFWAIYQMIHGLLFRLCQKNKSGLSSDVKESAKINRDNFYTNIFTITKTIQRENIIKGLRRTNKFAHTNLQNYTH